MKPLWIATREEIQAIDRRAIEAGLAVEDLIEQAGRAVCWAIVQLPIPAKRVLFIAGNGNNGADALSAACQWLDSGNDAACWIPAGREALSEVCGEFLKRFVSKAPGYVLEGALEPREFEETDLIVDGLLGTGAIGPPRGAIAKAIEAINLSGKPVLSIDIPSGIDCDTGQQHSPSIKAIATVVMALPKRYLFCGGGPECAGSWHVGSIPLLEPFLAGPLSSQMIDFEWLRDHVPRRPRNAHKLSNGEVLIVAGSDSMPGAAVLSALGAFRAGAGLVTVASTNSVCEHVIDRLPEAKTLVLNDPREVLAARKWASLVIGPGLGRTDSTPIACRAFLDGFDGPKVIDADAVWAVSQGACAGSNAVFTPHSGEMGMLLGKSPDEIEGDRFAAVEACARRFGTTILKGSFSLIATPGQPTAVSPFGNPGMATAGSGDVLSGVLGALVGQVASLHQAAVLGTAWHGLAGDHAKSEIGEVGFVASEIADRLPSARARILEVRIQSASPSNEPAN